MGNYDADAASNMLHGYAQEGVWKKYNVPLSQRWIWTLGAVKTSILLGCFALFLTFSQARSWVLIRYFVHLRKKAVRLEGDNKPDVLADLSQGKAITDMLPSVFYRLSSLWRLARLQSRARSGSPGISDESDSPVISMWFGIFASLNLIIFGALGIALPYLLLEGTLGASVVKSKMTESCLASSGNDEETSVLFKEQVARTDAIFGACLDRLNEGCGSQYYLQKPQITKKRSDCPFPGDVCHHRAAKAFEVTHSNITAFELGVNSFPRLNMNHRLTCAPVHLDSFLRFDSKDAGAIETVISISDDTLQESSNLNEGIYTEPLYTMNGPNSFSNETSGKIAFNISVKAKGQYNLMILPSYGVRGCKKLGPSSPAFIHSDLRRKDGESFLILQRTGTSTSPTKIDDPFFAAHETMQIENEFSAPVIKYIPDYEVTALGCFEQFQFCDAKSRICTSWAAFLEGAFEDIETQLKRKGIPSSLEHWMVLASQPTKFSVSEYLRERTHGSKVPLTSWIPWANPTVLNSRDQWITEVETWSMKNLLNSILFAQTGARVQLGNWTNHDSTAHGNQPRLCDRILFRDSNYTNVNWIGLWIAISVLSILCIASYTIKEIDLKSRRAWKMFVVLPNVLWEKMKLMTNVLGKNSGELMRKGNLNGGVVWLLARWSQTLFPRSSTSRPPPNDHGMNRTGDLSELRPVQLQSNLASRENQRDDIV